MIPSVLFLDEPPIDIGRDEAAQEAAKELSKSAYRQSGGSIIERAIAKVLEWVGDLLDSLTGSSPNGHAGLVMLIGLLALIVVVVLWRAGVLRTSHRDAAGGVRHRQTADCGRVPGPVGAGGGVR